MAKMNASLHICLLGPPIIRYDDHEVLGFVSRSAQALFYFLAATRQRQDRSHLAALLWPDIPEEKARKNLRDVFSNLRKLMGDALHITRDWAAFDTNQPCTLDLTLFESCAGRWKREGDIDALQQMATLYCGDFLEGFHLPGSVEFETWLLTERDRLREHAIWAMDILIDLALQEHDFATGLAYSRRVLTLEPWREKAQCQRMRLLAASGQPAAALIQYHNYKSYLKSEFGLEPMPETIRLYEEIRANRASDAELPTAAINMPAVDARIPLHHRHNLPRQFTPLFGREVEIAQIAARLRDPDCALVTITGEGGVGKTRLALAVAQQLTMDFPDGVWFVPLAGLVSYERTTMAASEEFIADALGATIACAMGFTLQNCGRIFNQVLDALKVQKTLLVLDNFEHIAEFSTILLRILAACPYLSILITSRHRLRLQAEWVFVVSGLPVPENVSSLMTGDALLAIKRYSCLQLFSERAQRNDANFALHCDNLEAVLTICRILDGLPLGIELAAGLLPDLKPGQIATELQRSHHILTTDLIDIPPRHRSLQALFDFSWHLLSSDESKMLAACAIFEDRFTATASVSISGLPQEHLQALVHKSLLRQVDEGRFVMHPVVQHWAFEKLASDELHLAEIKRAFQDYFLSYVAERQQKIGNDAVINQEVRDEYIHILAAWRFAVEQRNLEMLERGARGVSRLFGVRGALSEAAQFFVDAVECAKMARLQLDQPDSALALLGRLLAEASYFHGRAGDFELGCSEADQAVTIARQIDDSKLLVDSLQARAYTHYFAGNFAKSWDDTNEALRLARLIGYTAAEALGLNVYAIGLQYLGRIDEAVEIKKQSVDLAYSAGETRLALINAASLGVAYLERGDLWLARLQFKSLLPLCRQLTDDLAEGFNRILLAKTNLGLGDLAEAIKDGMEALTVLRRIAARRHESQTLAALSLTYHQTGDQETAYAYAQQALQIADSFHIERARAEALLALGIVFSAQGQASKACDVFSETARIAEQVNDALVALAARIRCARLRLALRQHEEAQQLVEIVLPQLHELNKGWFLDPIALHIQCYTVLTRVGNSKAWQILHSGHELLCKQASLIPEEKARHRFLNNIPSHQEMARLWRSKCSYARLQQCDT